MREDQVGNEQNAWWYTARMVKTKKSDLEKFAGMVMDELHEFRAEVSERFESVDKRFDKVEARLDSLETEMRAMRFEVAGSTTSRP